VRVAHTLKGVSGSIGASDLQAVATKLESALIDGAGDQFEALCAQAGAELARVVDLINDLQSAGTASAGGQAGALPADFEEQLKALLGLLEEYDSAAEDKLQEILDQAAGTEASDRLHVLKGAIGQYDFETAASDLASIIESIQPLIQSSTGDPSAALPGDLDEQLQGLLGLLEEYDSSAEDRLLEILEQVKGADIEDRLKGLKRLIGQYDFEAAVEALKPIIEQARSEAKDND
jgi:HPt (histidine-containing phosphotransfer) domain-containing protein